MERDQVVMERARQALASKSALDPAAAPLSLKMRNGALIVAGELANVALKRRALARLTDALDGVEVVDRLQVAPTERMSDRQIRDRLRDILFSEPAFAGHMLIAIDRGSPTVLRRPAVAAGRIEFEVDGGVVTLNGSVTTLARKRLVGVLAWWIPGRRDVANGITVERIEGDDRCSIKTDIARILERDAEIDASGVTVSAEDFAVRLAGTVRRQREREIAEFDAWYVFGVAEVTNDIQVQTELRSA